ncbi:hypothetical protein M5689_014978 [Euphorbia peplus]|nr:hypothetical protein M5689_014978 [Euphorbia peplus]
MESSMLNQAPALRLLISKPFSTPLNHNVPVFPNIKVAKQLDFRTRKRVGGLLHSAARRRILAYEEDEEDEEYGHNEEIAMLESYSLSARDEALLVQAFVDNQQVEVLIFKGFSSSLSYKTSADPSRSVIPARGVIKSIDRIKGPFDPSNIQYLEKGLSWDSFKSRFTPT